MQILFRCSLWWFCQCYRNLTELFNLSLPSYIEFQRSKGCPSYLINGEQVILVTMWCHHENVRIKFKRGDRLWSSGVLPVMWLLISFPFNIHFLLFWKQEVLTFFLYLHTHILCIYSLLSCDSWWVSQVLNEQEASEGPSVLREMMSMLSTLLRIRTCCC